MKSQKIVFIFSLVLYINNSFAMEFSHSKTEQLLSTRFRSRDIISRAYLSFMKRQISLDELFERVLPIEITRYIVRLAYENEFHSYFFSDAALKNFFNYKICYYKKASVDLSSSIRSFSNKACEYPSMSDLTCLVTLQSEKNEEVLMGGFIDGTIATIDAATLTRNKIGGPNHTSPVSAFTYKSKRPLLAGYQDGSLAVIHKQHTQNFSIKCSEPISCIASTSSNVYLIGSGNTLALLRLDNALCNAGTPVFYVQKYLFGTVQSKIVALGVHKGQIVVQTANKCFFNLSPYSNTHYEIIEKCAFSPLQARYIFCMIEGKKSDIKEEEVAAFKKLPLTIQSYWRDQKMSIDNNL